MAASLTEAATPLSQCIADMLCLGFFFLLRPGEYTGSASTDSSPFRLADITFYLGGLRLDTATTSDARLQSATFVTLEFTSQKNGVRGEVIGHGLSGNPSFCPVRAAARRVLHLRTHAALPTTPLAAVWHPASTSWKLLTPTDLTTELRLAAGLLGPRLGFLPQHVSARSLRAAGAMALLCANVDSDRIRLIGRWRSDTMLRYLHVQAAPFMHNFASRMVSGGHFSLLPNRDVPLL
eukprot:scaffold23366_cov215-Cylindrotheca_fusiformis.AAC.1